MGLASGEGICYTSDVNVTYKSRIADTVLAEKLSYMGAVLVRGPKWCGKTTTCEQIAKSAIYMDDSELMAQYQSYAAINVKDLLCGEQPRLIDEWQLAPQFWDAVRFEVDHSPGLGHFILTGSSVPPETDVHAKPEVRKIYHTGTGRIAKMTMRTMSLFESGESSGEVSMGALLRGKAFSFARARPMRLEDMAFLACRGGWPVATLMTTRRRALRYAHEYYVSVTESDISRVDGVREGTLSAEKTQFNCPDASVNVGDGATFHSSVPSKIGELLGDGAVTMSANSTNTVSRRLSGRLDIGAASDSSVVKLADGATLDLSANEEPFVQTSGTVFAGEVKVALPSGVAKMGRTKLISWSEPPEEGVTFSAAGTSPRHVRFESRSDGFYLYRPGMMISVK